jgi:hypothetical protein
MASRLRSQPGTFTDVTCRLKTSETPLHFACVTNATSSPTASAADTRMLRVVRREHFTTLTADVGCWHARPLSVSVMLVLAPGCSPWRIQAAHGYLVS